MRGRKFFNRSEALSFALVGQAMENTEVARSTIEVANIAAYLVELSQKVANDWAVVASTTNSTTTTWYDVVVESVIGPSQGARQGAIGPCLRVGKHCPIQAISSQSVAIITKIGDMASNSNMRYHNVRHVKPNVF